MPDVGAFLSALTSQFTPQARLQSAQARQQLQDIQTQQKAQALAGLYALGNMGGQGAQPAAAPQPAAPMTPVPRPATPPPAAPPASAAPAAAVPPAPAGATSPAPAPAQPPQAAPVSAAPQAQGPDTSGFDSHAAFADVMTQTQTALANIQNKLRQQYKTAYGTDPDPQTLLKATDLILGQMKQLSPDTAAAMRLNMQQQQLAVKDAEFQENQQRLHQAEADKAAYEKENLDLRGQIAQLQAQTRVETTQMNDRTRQSVANTSAGARIGAANIGAASRENVASQNNATRTGIADQANDTKMAGYQLKQAETAYTTAQRALASLRANGGSSADINAAQAQVAQAKIALDNLKFAPSSGGAGSVNMPKSGQVISKVAKNGKTIYSDDNGKTWYAKN